MVPVALLHADGAGTLETRLRAFALEAYVLPLTGVTGSDEVSRGVRLSRSGPRAHEQRAQRASALRREQT